MNRQVPLISDAPIDSIRDDLLWRSSDIYLRIQEIVNTILSSEEPLTFAIHGPWGSGKTSFLRIVEESLKKNNQDDPVVRICWYNASAYQNVSKSIGDAAITLILRILDTLSGGDPEKNAKLYLQLVRSFQLGQHIEDEPHIEGSPMPFVLLQSLAEKMAVLANFGELLERYLRGQSPFSTGESKLVLIIDDLDRCSLEFIGEVVETTQRLGAVRGMFTLLAIDKPRLWKALEQRFEDMMDMRGVRWAAEKYIQYSVDLPMLDERLLDPFLEGLRRTPETDLSGESRAQRMAENDASLAIVVESKYFAVGIPNKTPRLIKRCINYIHPELSSRVEKGEKLSENLRQTIIKERVLAYVWDDFYNDYWVPGREGKYPALAVCTKLERACQEYVRDVRNTPPDRRDERWASFEYALQKIRSSEGLREEELVVPPELATLLGTPPFFFARQEGASPFKEAQPEPSGTLPYSPELSKGEMSTNLDEEFTKFYIMSEQADAMGDGQTSVQAAAQAYDLVLRNRRSFGKRVAPQLGNLGVNAEKYRALDLAEQIWRLALEFDPDHTGTLQQFVSYIIDNRPDLYSEAEEILKRLQSGVHREHQPWRTLSLLAQLRTASGQGLDEELLAQLREAAAKEKDARQMGHILNAVIRGEQVRQGVELFTSAVDRFPGAKQRYTLQRIVADALASRPAAESEFIAMDLYRQLLANPEAIDPGDEPDVMHNYATLLYKHDYDDEAGCLWFKAYQTPKGRNDGSIRRAYSMYLLRANRGDLAEKVIKGEPVDEMILFPTEKKIPGRFSDIELPTALGQSGESFSCIKQAAV